jgi:hypothetical protein
MATLPQSDRWTVVDGVAGRKERGLREPTPLVTTESDLRQTPLTPDSHRARGLAFFAVVDTRLSLAGAAPGTPFGLRHPATLLALHFPSTFR